MPSQPSKNGSHSSDNGKTKITESTLKSILMLQRRALLQSVHADEKMIEELSKVSEDFGSGEITDLNEVILSYVKITIRNAENRRKALLQIVRDVEKRYSIKRKRKRK